MSRKYRNRPTRDHTVLPGEAIGAYDRPACNAGARRRAHARAAQAGDRP